MSRLLDWLNEVGFDWTTGRVIVVPTTGYSPGWSSDDELELPRLASQSDELLTQEFDGGYGSPQCPRFIAEDSRRIYFPYQYDGSTGLVVVEADLDAYLSGNVPTPYPGG
jgi:hypothetical protein